MLSIQIKSRNSEKCPWPVAGLRLEASSLWLWPILSLSRYCFHSCADCVWSSPQDPHPHPTPVPPLMEYLKQKIVDTTWIKIIFGKWENKHICFSLGLHNKFSNIGTLITAWLTIHLFSTRACTPAVIGWTLLISHCRLELLC